MPVPVPKRTGRKAFTQAQARAARRKYLAGQIPSKQTRWTKKTVKYPERKFAWPALRKVAYKILPLWKGVFKSATVKGQ